MVVIISFYKMMMTAIRKILTAFIKQYYNEASFVPREILLPVLPAADELIVLEEWLTARAGRKVEFLQPGGELNVNYCILRLKMQPNFLKRGCAKVRFR